jgi:hypothetical protein
LCLWEDKPVYSILSGSQDVHNNEHNFLGDFMSFGSVTQNSTKGGNE